MAALNPVHRIGKQLVEAIRLHKKVSARTALEEAVEWLEKVGIPAPEQRVNEYPHQLSGGMLRLIGWLLFGGGILGVIGELRVSRWKL